MAGPALISVGMIIVVMMAVNIMIILIIMMINQGQVSQTGSFISQLQNNDHVHDGPDGKSDQS